MAKAREAQILTFSLPNKVGQLSAVSDLIAGAKINIEAILAVESGAQAEFHVVTAKNPKARKALAPLGVEVHEEPGLCVDMANKAGSLGKLSKRLAAASINITRVWGTSFKGKTATAVLQTSDDKKALASLKKKKK